MICDHCGNDIPGRDMALAYHVLDNHPEMVKFFPVDGHPFADLMDGEYAQFWPGPDARVIERPGSDVDGDD